MKDVSIFWSHGMNAQPWGNKSKRLAQVTESRGLQLHAPDYQAIADPDDRVQLLLENIREAGRPTILVGSSMGGYVSAAAAKETDILGLFLIAPAFYMKGYGTHMFSAIQTETTVVHGWKDDVIPVENSIRFSRLQGATLHILEGGHRLSSRVDDIAALFGNFLDKVLPQ